MTTMISSDIEIQRINLQNNTNGIRLITNKVSKYSCFRGFRFLQ